MEMENMGKSSKLSSVDRIRNDEITRKRGWGRCNIRKSV